MMPLSKDQIARYGRQLVLPEVGVPGQQRLLGASVLLVGAGGLGSPAALYLAGAGIGTLGIADPDTVALSNLHRQVLHTVARVGQPKPASAAEALRQLNPEVTVRALPEAVGPDNACRLAAAYDVVLDGSDNFVTRYLVNDACVLTGTPLVHGAAVHLRGQLLTVQPRRSACLRCVFPEPPAAEAIPGCRDAGVLGSVTGVLGSLMAHEAVKVLLGVGTPYHDRLLMFDGLDGVFREAQVRRDPGCAVCGETPTVRSVTAIDDPVWTHAQMPGGGGRTSGCALTSDV